MWARTSSPATARGPHARCVYRSDKATAASGPPQLSSRPSTQRRRAAATGAGAGSAGDVVVDVKEALTHGVDHCFHPRVEVQLLEDVTHVVLHRVLGDVELVADLPVALTLGHQLEDLELPLGQRRRRVLLLLVGAPGQARVLVEELGGHRR